MRTKDHKSSLTLLHTIKQITGFVTQPKKYIHSDNLKINHQDSNSWTLNKLIIKPIAPIAFDSTNANPVSKVIFVKTFTYPVRLVDIVLCWNLLLQRVATTAVFMVTIRVKGNTMCTPKWKHFSVFQFSSLLNYCKCTKVGTNNTHIPKTTYLDRLRISWGLKANGNKMDSSTIFQAPPQTAYLLWSCDKDYHKQEVCFFVFSRSDCQLTIHS